MRLGKLFHRLSRFSLRMLFVGLTVICAATGWITLCRREWAEIEQALQAFNAQDHDVEADASYWGGNIYNEQKPSWYVASFYRPTVVTLRIYQNNEMSKDLLRHFDSLGNAGDISILGDCQDDVFRRVIGRRTEALHIYGFDYELSAASLAQSRKYHHVEIRERPLAAEHWKHLATCNELTMLICHSSAEPVVDLPKGSFPKLHSLNVTINDPSLPRSDSPPSWIDGNSELVYFDVAGEHGQLLLRAIADEAVAAKSISITIPALTDRELRFLNRVSHLEALSVTSRIDAETLEYLLEHVSSELQLANCLLPALYIEPNGKERVCTVEVRDCDGAIEELEYRCRAAGIEFKRTTNHRSYAEMQRIMGCR